MPNFDQPCIGIPVRLDVHSSDRRVRRSARIFEDVVSLVEATGARVIRLEPGERFKERTEACDGFVVPGGGDVSPGRYGGDSDHPALFGVDVGQDELDAEIIRIASGTRRPLLGICRGMQMLNVAMGGSLIVNLPVTSVSHAAPGGDTAVPHTVTLTGGTRTAIALKAKSLSVQSAHHQAIDRLAPGLATSGVADDGCIEAVEGEDPRHWLVGVQWHPEMSPTLDANRSLLFEALVMAVVGPRKRIR